MEDAFKKLLYAGLGLAAQATEKVEKTVDELVEKGKLSNSEGKKIIDKFIEKTESRKEDFEDKFKGLMEKFGYTRTTEVEELKKRIEELESKLGGKSTKSSTKKESAKA